MKLFFAVLLLISPSAMGAEARLAVKALPDLPDPIGVAGPFVGVHNDALIVAGGANFPFITPTLGCSCAKARGTNGLTVSN